MAISRPEALDSRDVKRVVLELVLNLSLALRGLWQRSLAIWQNPCNVFGNTRMDNQGLQSVSDYDGNGLMMVMMVLMLKKSQQQLSMAGMSAMLIAIVATLSTLNQKP